MTEYVYRLTTNTPVTAAVSVGNMPAVYAPSSPGYAITRKGERQRAVSNGAAAADGHVFELELTEIREDVVATVDAFITELGIPMEPWQRSWLIAQITAIRYR